MIQRLNFVSKILFLIFWIPLGIAFVINAARVFYRVDDSLRTTATISLIVASVILVARIVIARIVNRMLRRLDRVNGLV